MNVEKSFTIDSAHPSLAGHFPGNPVVPGVVLLGEILERIGDSLGPSFMLAQVPSVKFHSPLRPNEPLQLTFEILTGPVVTFSCQVGSRLIASGQFIFHTDIQPSPPPPL